MNVSTFEEYAIEKPIEVPVETVKIDPRPEVEMKFKEEANITMKEIEKKIDTEQNRAIINKTMKNESLKKTTSNSSQVGWLKTYVGRTDDNKN
tara:strand:+ start:2720 stop:2998 length:279 start_codon:yes stop_codon:yes gene_type:complete